MKKLYEKLATKNEKELNKLADRIEKRINQANKRTDWLQRKVKSITRKLAEILCLIAEIQVGIEMFADRKKSDAIHEKVGTDYQVREMESLQNKLRG